MLKIIPEKWYSKNYRIINDDLPIGCLNMAVLNNTATITIKGEEYKAVKAGLFSHIFYLNKNERIIANAAKASLFSRTMHIDFDQSQFELKPQSIFSRTFQINQGEQIVGTIYQTRVFSRTITIDLPASIQSEQQVFMAWLVIILLNQRNQSNS